MNNFTDTQPKIMAVRVAEPRNAQEAFEQHPHFKEHPSDLKPFRAFIRKFGYDLTKRDAFEFVGFLQAFRVQQIGFAVDKARVEKELLIAHEVEARNLAKLNPDILKQFIKPGFVGKVIVTKSFSKNWTDNPQHYRDHFGAADVEIKE